MIVDGQFDVIYADPPWRYDFSRSKSRSIENHYSTMTHSDICNLSVPAKNNSILLLWAVAPRLPEALDVMSAWGFDYTTCAVWDKVKMGMGYYFRGQHELLLVGKRGTPPVPAPSTRPRSVIVSPRTRHSAKPEELYDLIDKMWPDCEKLELFARHRKPRFQWTFWGDQAD